MRVIRGPGGCGRKMFGVAFRNNNNIWTRTPSCCCFFGIRGWEERIVWLLFQHGICTIRDKSGRGNAERDRTRKKMRKKEEKEKKDVSLDDFLFRTLTPAPISVFSRSVCLCSFLARRPMLFLLLLLLLLLGYCCERVADERTTMKRAAVYKLSGCRSHDTEVTRAIFRSYIYSSSSSYLLLSLFFCLSYAYVSIAFSHRGTWQEKRTCTFYFILLFSQFQQLAGGGNNGQESAAVETRKKLQKRTGSRRLFLCLTRQCVGTRLADRQRDMRENDDYRAFIALSRSSTNGEIFRTTTCRS